MSDSYCKGCRDDPGGCELCNPAREELARRREREDLERAVLDASGNIHERTLRAWVNEMLYAGETSKGLYAQAELARRRLA